MSNSNGKLRGIVDLPGQPTPPAVCGKSEGVKARFEDGRYKLRFPRSCINDPAAIRAQAFMSFDKDPYAGGHGVEDLSDVTAFTPGVAFG